MTPIYLYDKSSTSTCMTVLMNNKVCSSEWTYFNESIFKKQMWYIYYYNLFAVQFCTLNVTSLAAVSILFPRLSCVYIHIVYKYSSGVKLQDTHYYNKYINLWSNSNVIFFIEINSVITYNIIGVFDSIVFCNRVISWILNVILWSNLW